MEPKAATNDPEVNTSKRETFWTRELKNSALFLAILTAILFFAGAIARASFLMALGLPHSIFPMKTEQALLIGASLFLDLISQHLFVLTLLILLIGLTLLALAKIPAFERFSADFVNLKKKAQAYKIWTLCKAALFLIGFALFYSWIYERSVQYGINEANSFRVIWTAALTVDSNVRRKSKHHQDIWNNQLDQHE